jgi:hypothetical protein
MALFSPTAVITLDTTTGTSSGTPFLYAVANQGGYSRDWKRYFSSQYLTYGVGLITGIDFGPGINVYTIQIMVTTWNPGSLPYKLGVTQTWDVQKANLEASFSKIATPLYFKDPFGALPNLGNFNGTGVYFTDFNETVNEWSTPNAPYLTYRILLTQSPPGSII